MFHNVLNASTIDSKENHFIDFLKQLTTFAMPPPRGGGLVPEKLEGDVQPASQILYPSYDR